MYISLNLSPLQQCPGWSYLWGMVPGLGLPCTLPRACLGERQFTWVWYGPTQYPGTCSQLGISVLAFFSLLAMLILQLGIFCTIEGKRKEWFYSAQSPGSDIGWCGLHQEPARSLSFLQTAYASMEWSSLKMRMYKAVPIMFRNATDLYSIKILFRESSILNVCPYCCRV